MAIAYESMKFDGCQMLLGELCKGKALKEVELVDGLLKYNQSVCATTQVDTICIQR
jgi:hypothetical protein